MSFLRSYTPREECHRFYGVAWEDPIKQLIWAAPVPFNYIITLARNIWWGLKAPRTLVKRDTLLKKLEVFRDRCGGMTMDLWWTEELLIDIQRWLKQGSLSTSDPLYPRIQRLLVDAREHRRIRELGL